MVWNTSMLFFPDGAPSGLRLCPLLDQASGRPQTSCAPPCSGRGVGCVTSGGGPRRWQPRGENPAIWLLALLIVAIGLSFFVVSMTSPTLQRWFATLGHRSADDPCFLYAAATWVDIVARDRADDKCGAYRHRSFLVASVGARLLRRRCAPFRSSRRARRAFCRRLCASPVLQALSTSLITARASSRAWSTSARP